MLAKVLMNIHAYEDIIHQQAIHTVYRHFNLRLYHCYLFAHKSSTKLKVKNKC